MILPNDKIVIVGAGCFGVSTAYHLLKRGFINVTILDRSQVLPAIDAASNDYNKIVRSSYSDIFYAKLARVAIQAWKAEQWGDTYHESGVLVLGNLSTGGTKGTAIAADSKGVGQSGAHGPGAGIVGGPAYANESLTNDLALGARLETLGTNDSEPPVRHAFPINLRSKIPEAPCGHLTGFLNLDGGWADAAQGLQRMTNMVIALGGNVLTGHHVVELLRCPETKRTTGVLCADGKTVLDATVVVLAMGSWTPSAIPGLDLNGNCFATGQCVATIQLTSSEAKLYQECPVVLDFSSGFYIFPPNSQNIMKMAIHSAGYTNTIAGVSTPRTATSDPQGGAAIPKSSLHELRIRLREVYPDLAGKPFSSTRLCWYNDTPDGDWVIGAHPDDPSLVFATGDSGHAYKFLPVIGRLVADTIQGTLQPDLIKKFAVDREHTHVDLSRAGKLAELELSELCTGADLLQPVNN